MIAPALIGLDWGSSGFRAYLMARDGAVLDAIATADGIASVSPGGFPATFRRVLGDWLEAYPTLPVLASGMVGSRNGWREAPYVACPADLSAIAENLVAVEADGRRVLIAPGLAFTDANGEPDVMRGEEVEILGIAEGGARLVVLPGSHCKWAVVQAGRVLRFKTFITGELFAAIRDHTLIGAFARAAPPRPPGAAFARGARRGAAAVRGEGDGLLGALFGARSLPLMGALAEADAGDYLSGLLIGAEIAEAGARLVVLPGSHCKWAVIEAGRVLRFKTFVTGELFAAIRDHTLIGAFARAAPSRAPAPAFARGARRGAAAVRGEGGGLLGALFGARSLPLMGALAEADAGDYLSGLLIGAEIAEARRLFPGETAHLAGAKGLVARYRTAFAALGEETALAPDQAAARGLLLVARQAGLL